MCYFENIKYPVLVFNYIKKYGNLGNCDHYKVFVSYYLYYFRNIYRSDKNSWNFAA